MTAIAYYLLKVCLCSGLLFLYYHAALKNKAFHQWNRFYLLLAVTFSVTLPLVQVMVLAGKENNAAQWVQAVQSADEYLEAITVSSKPLLSTEQWIAAGYATVSLAILIALLFSILKIKRLAKTCGVQLMEDIRFVNTSHPAAPFSFLRYIFWNKAISLASETGQQIFRHEVVHVKERHTLDKLFMQAVLALFWCNPFFWFIKKELRFVHEFIADKKAVGKGGAAAFAAMLLQTAYPSHHSSLVNPFFQTSIKRRLAMFTKKQNPRLNYISRIVALPLMALVVFAFSVRTKKESMDPSVFVPSLLIHTDTIPKAKKEIASVDVNSVKKLLTVYYTDGSCETMTEKQANDRGLIHDSGYVNVKKGTPQNGAVKMQVRLKDSSVKPLVVINGDVVKYELMNAIDPSKVESINVLKGPSAIVKYGNKGENGVIEIKTKNGTSLTLEQVDITGRSTEKNDLSAVIVQGKPLKDDATNSNAENNSDSKKELTEVTVFGHRAGNEPIFEQTETPASVDKNEWRAFLAKSAQPIIDDMVRKGAKPGTYTANVRFLVEKDGSVSDVKLLDKMGYDADDKILQMMKSSPKWTPAQQNGKAVRSYHTQPITMMISNQ